VPLLHKPLWWRGEAAALSARPAVTIVGARAASAAGEALAYALGAALAEMGGLVISGGALGIDAAAHRGALSVNGRTCAVLGCGVDIAYPQRHASLFMEIARRGCLLSSFAPGTQPLSWHFPVRNELMAVLADLVVIIEARADSGSLITAKQARRHGRRLAAFAGSPGAASALASGAHRVDSVADVLALLDGGSDGAAASRVGSPAPSFLNESSAAEDEQGAEAAGSLAVLAALSRSATDLGELCARTGLSPGDCAAALVDLELRGRCTRLAGGRYIVHAPLS
jgi:DNA processing protein